ncbi:TadE/TadG family type IV pilus assembly protein [Streptomyces coffeae]|uniref:Pilus assembly protein n=1 Tax=Streptomyces coffeae TaxID=621382 RepID=A0ABS1NS50_9ACTN|nr:TadE/TadG family type IV pilus assembly protein [Streptomyces coffeae]MBL1102902.1 pilus assembly protein [Streptomyces coffeae]
MSNPPRAGTTVDRGSAAVELVLVTPLLLLVLMTVVALGRLTDARLVVADTAHQAARAASLARTQGQALTTARRTARASLDHAGTACSQPQVTLTTSGLQPGSTVTAHICCTVTLTDLTRIRMPGRITVHQTAHSPVDVHRSTR